MRWRRFIVSLVVLATQAAIGVALAPQAGASSLYGYQLPWRSGLAHAIAGSWYGQGGHTGAERYALDWSLAYEPVLATKAGTVMVAVRGVKDPGPSACKKQTGYGDYVVIDHHDGVRSLYAHLSRVTVGYGQRVRQGQVLGISGNSGWSCGAHLHFRLTRYGAPVKPEPMGGYSVFPDNHARLYVAKTRLNGSLPPAIPAQPVSKPAPLPRRKPERAPREHGEAHIVGRAPLAVLAQTFTAGEPVTFTYKAANTGTAAATVAVFGVKVYTPNEGFFILPCVNGQNRVFSPGALFACSVTQELEAEGPYVARAGWLDTSGTWHSRALGEAVTFEMRAPALAVDQPQHVIAVPSFTQGATATYTFLVHNPAAVPVPVQSIYVRVWKPGGAQVSLPCAQGENIELAPQQLFACTVSDVLERAGRYTYRANWQDESGRYHSDEIAQRETFDVSEPPTATLHVHVDGPGRVNFSGITCSSDCTKRYPAGTSVTLTATARRSGQFAQWADACAGTEPSCGLTLNQDVNVTATFTLAGAQPTPSPSVSPSPPSTPLPTISPSL